MREANGTTSLKEHAVDGDRGRSRSPIVVFEVAQQRFALPLTVVERIERAVAITPLTGAPPPIAGVIDVRGEVIPVIALRSLWNLPARPLSLSDQLLIATGARRRYALLIDSVIDAVRYDPATLAAPESLAARSDSLRGAVSMDNDIVFIHDLDHFLSLDVECDLDRALDRD